jgi:hypothetical protein
MAKEHGRTPGHDGQAIRPSTPTGTMRERIALCGGKIDGAGPDMNGWHLAVRMPCAAEGALL